MSRVVRPKFTCGRDVCCVALGEVIALRRERMRIQQHALADIVGSSQATISRLERGEHSPITDAVLHKVAAHLKTSRFELQRDEDVTMRNAETAVLAICPRTSMETDEAWWKYAQRISSPIGLVGIVRFAASQTIQWRVEMGCLYV